MNRFVLRRLLTLFAAFGTLSAPTVSVAHGHAHVHRAGDPSVLHEVSQHAGPLASVPGISPVGADSDHDALHTDCTLGQPRGRLVATPTFPLAAAPACAPLSLKPTRQERIIEVPWRVPLGLKVSPLHARAPPGR
jgi:hypothetical protein